MPKVKLTLTPESTEIIRTEIRKRVRSALSTASISMNSRSEGARALVKALLEISGEEMVEYTGSPAYLDVSRHHWEKHVRPILEEVLGRKADPDPATTLDEVSSF